MTILQQPDILSLSGNIKEFRISTTEPISFALQQGASEVIAQSYTPGKDGLVTINLRDIVHSRLSFTLRESALVYEQPSLVATFIAIISGTAVTFRVIRSGVDRLSDTTTNFLTQNFLTWQPSIKAVTYYSPEFLTYYAVIACTARLRAYFTDGSTSDPTQQDVILAHFDADKAYTIPLQYASVAEKLGNKLPAYYDVWIESSTSTRLTYIQRYCASDMLSEQEQWILFENSLGGLDTFRAYGSTDFTAEHTHNIAEIDEISTEYRVDTTRKFQKNTGHLTDKQRRWLLDFFPSQSKYIYAGTYLRSIVVSESNVTYTDRELPSNYTFTYKYADARPLLNLPRTDIPSEALHITVPSVGSFTVPPRLVEFPRLPLTEGALLPIQNPYSEQWNTTTAGSLSDFIAERLSQNYGGSGGVGHQHNNIDLLQLLTHAAEYLLVAGKKVKAGYADKAGTIDGIDDIFIHKDRPDIANFLLQLLGGANVGPAIDSFLHGKGIVMTPDGRIQADYIEVRRALKVMELIINELNAMSGDYSFSDSGTIEKIDDLGNNTYRLRMSKRTDTDWTTLGTDDVMYSIINNLRTGGTDYYTSWFRCLAKNVTDNTLTVVLYPDSEVPGGKNFPPAVDYNVTRRGNADIRLDGSHNERSDSWMLSSREGSILFLQNVFKPILDVYNYALSIGRFPDIDAIKHLPIGKNDMGILAKTIVCENLYRYDYNGNIVASEVFRGEWSAAVATGDAPYRFVTHQTETPNGTKLNELEQHTVYRHGCKWGCLIDKTTDEPKWNSPGWKFLEGNSHFSITFGSTAGFQFFYGAVNTTVVASVFFGSQDITDQLLAMPGADVQWTRNTENVPDDNAWHPTFDGAKNLLKLTQEDMGRDWLLRRKTIFTCTVFIPSGEGFDTKSGTIGFNL